MAAKYQPYKCLTSHIIINTLSLSHIMLSVAAIKYVEMCSYPPYSRISISFLQDFCLIVKNVDPGGTRNEL